jgi:hypothetical protein
MIVLMNGWKGQDRHDSRISEINMATAHDSGAAGEREIVRKIPCPNCRRALMPLPRSFPLFDVQCTGCMFRAQVKTARCAPKDQIFGAGYEVLEKSLKAGQLLPPLIVNFRWTAQNGVKRQEVWFFPFLTRENIAPRTRSSEGHRPGYREFNYVGLKGENLPRRLLLTVPKSWTPSPSV